VWLFTGLLGLWGLLVYGVYWFMGFMGFIGLLGLLVYWVYWALQKSGGTHKWVYHRSLYRYLTLSVVNL
jgi:hypothetical protein